MKRLPNLTRYESIGINRAYNVADGHAHQPQTAGQRQIVSRLPELFYDAEAARQSELEGNFAVSSTVWPVSIPPPVFRGRSSATPLRCRPI
ncbi:hypothetical protein LJK88_01800 [Paenibacillus sp. P26]|nr:hypothetical protein LJK88_01800 [Paenibacillus sp. P26]